MPAAADENEREIDLGDAWGLNPQVALRPESFGALAYHFGTRRLSFLKSRALLAVVQGLAEHPDALSACRAAGVGDAELPRYRHALATLAVSGMIVRREVAR
jgi:putative mycofactocin binding protein MftB